MTNKKNILFIVLAGAVVYINSLRNLFVWDDILIIINNDFIKGYKLIIELCSKPFFYFAGPEFQYYRPIQGLSNLFDYSVWGLNPFGFHLTNLLLHIFAAITVYIFIKLLFDDQQLSFFAALIFAIHPLNVSVVAYITGRSDILMTIFVFLSLTFFLKASSYKFYLLSLACFACALLSKETALIFPVCLVFINEVYIRMSPRKGGANSFACRFWYLAFLLFSIMFVLFRLECLGLRSNIMPLNKINLLVMLHSWFVMVYQYLKLIFFPIGLHMLRAIDISPVTSGIIISCFFIIIFSAVVMFSLYRRNKIIFSGFGLFFIWIAPAASLAFRNLEYYFQQKAVMEEHWLYLPQIGIFIVAAYFIKKGLQYFNNQIYKILLILIMVSLSFITIRETGFWRDNYTFFTHTSKFVNYSSTVYRNLGWIYVNRNESSRAIDMYSRALGLKQPDKLKKVLNKEIAYVYFLNNQPKKAAEFCRQAIGLDSNYADAHACLGAIYSRDDLNSAIGEWKIALEQDPFNGLALNNLLNLSKTKNDIRNYLIKKYENLFNQTQYFERYRIYSVLGMIYLYSDLNSEALLYLQKASQINPYSVDINNGLAILYVNLKDYEKAIGFFKTTLKLNPFYRPAYDNLSLLYSRLNKSKQAELLLEKINSINMYE